VLGRNIRIATEVTTINIIPLFIGASTLLVVVKYIALKAILLYIRRTKYKEESRFLKSIYIAYKLESPPALIRS
jgi:hypothetical protein